MMATDTVFIATAHVPHDMECVQEFYSPTVGVGRLYRNFNTDIDERMERRNTGCVEFGRQLIKSFITRLLTIIPVRICCSPVTVAIPFSNSHRRTATGIV